MHPQSSLAAVLFKMEASFHSRAPMFRRLLFIEKIPEYLQSQGFHDCTPYSLSMIDVCMQEGLHTQQV